MCDADMVCIVGIPIGVFNRPDFKRIILGLIKSLRVFNSHIFRGVDTDFIFVVGHYDKVGESVRSRPDLAKHVVNENGFN